MAVGRPTDFLTKEESKELIETQVSFELGIPFVAGKGFMEYLEALFIREYFCTEEQLQEYNAGRLKNNENDGGWDEAIEKYKFLCSQIDQDVIRWEKDLKYSNIELYNQLEEEIKERIECVHLYGYVPILLGEYFKEKGIENNLADSEIVKAFANNVPFDWILDKIQIQPQRLLVTTKMTQEHIYKINDFMHDELGICATILPLSFDLNGVIFGKLNNTGKFAFLFKELEIAGFIRNDWQRCISLGIVIKSQKTDVIKHKDISKALTKANQEQYDSDKIEKYKQIKKFVKDLQEFQ